MMKLYFLKRMAVLWNVNLYFCINERCDKDLENSSWDITQAFQDSNEFNPLFICDSLRNDLIQKAFHQQEPCLWKDSFQVYYACIRTKDGFYLAGPMNTAIMNCAEAHRYYCEYGIPSELGKQLNPMTLMEILQIICALTNYLTQAEYTEQHLLEANYLGPEAKMREREDIIRFTIESDDIDMYRHTYQEEQNLLNMVRSGRTEEAIHLSMAMDANVGRLGSHAVVHWRNMLVVGVTLCTRAAIESGVIPYVAYRISDFYINKALECTDVSQILLNRNHAIEELTNKVRELRHMNTSSYTERCKDYVRKHFREKIYLKDIAGKMGISSSYLSRLFKQETGEYLQDYINRIRVERAANLLIYSDERIPQIAEYVNFPSQSYFGKIFKAKTNMTPRQYRNAYKPAEFIDTAENK